MVQATIQGISLQEKVVLVALPAVNHKVWQNRNNALWNNTIECTNYVVKEIKQTVKMRVVHVSRN